MAAPQLAAIFPFEDTAPLSSQPVRYDSPQELTFRFDQGQIIDAASLSTQIRLLGKSVDGNSTAFNATNDRIIPGFLGIGQQPNEVVMRFNTPLTNDAYQIIFTGVRNTAGQVMPSKTVDFTLDLAPQVVAVVPQPMSRGAGNSLAQARNQIVVYFNNDDLLDSVASAENPNFYSLIFTNGTATTADDSAAIHPTSVSYTAGADTAVLTFANDLHLLGPGNTVREGTYRLRIGNDFVTPLAPQVFTEPAVDTTVSFATAQAVTLTNGQTVVMSGAISPERFKLSLPGSDNDPGHEHVLGGAHVGPNGDASDGITTQTYNFKAILVADGDGNSVYANNISETQKLRAREAFELWGKYLGIKFVETNDETDASAWVIATSDLASVLVIPPEVSLPNDNNLYAIGALPTGHTALVLDRAEIGDLTNPGFWGNAEFGGNYFEAMMSGIGALLGLQPTHDLPPLNSMGSQFGGTTYGGDLQPTPDIVADLDPTTNLGTHTVERVFPSANDIIHGQYLFRPESKDIDVYSISLASAGTVRLETVAERLSLANPGTFTSANSTTGSSLLNTVISVFDASGNLVARNDDYFSDDSFLELTLTVGTYYVAVSSTGNTEFDLGIADSGFGGTTQGAYQLRMNFTQEQTTGIVDATGRLLDGDYDGKAGGAYNFWFQVAAPANTIYVDKIFTGTSTGALSSPYKTIPAAFAAAAPGKVVRIVGNGTAATLTANKAYEIGQKEIPADPNLTDGTDFQVPKGVTVMIDAGAIFKLRRANLSVGSFAQGVDRGSGALQILGTPTNPVYFTSFFNEAIGNDALTRPNTPNPGDWGGIVFQNKIDYEEGRAVAESEGIFLNYMNHADISYGGGTVRIGSNDVPFDPVTLVEARPTLTFNTIRNNSNSAISADPNSFAETRYYDLANTYELAYARVGPEVVGNNIINNTINALFIRIKTDAGRPIDVLTKQARFNDNIVHVLTDTLLIQGQPGGPLFNRFSGPLVGGIPTGMNEARLDARLRIDAGTVLKIDEGRIETQMSANLIAEGDKFNRIIFTSLSDKDYGGSGTFDTAPSVTAVKDEGDWGGIYFHPASRGNFDYAFIGYAGGENIIEGDTAFFNALEIHGAEVRVANSEFAHNDFGGDVDAQQTAPRIFNTRNGRGTNANAVIFVRGAQPILIDNLIHDNDTDEDTDDTAAISIDVNSMIGAFKEDSGRATGAIDRHEDLRINQGPLVNGNRLENNPLNGMTVRGGILTTESVWDDTNITHVVPDPILVLNFHTFGGLRIQSRPTESLVVKFDSGAGLTASGVAMDLSDRIGGSVQIIGFPSQPVVLTSIADDTAGAGLDLLGRPQFDTNNDGVSTGVTTGPTFPPATGPFTVTPNNNATQLVNGMLFRPLPAGVTIASSTYTGDAAAAGTYINGDSVALEIAPRGIVLSTGNANLPATNTTGFFSTNNPAGVDGDPDMDALAGTATFDGAFLTITINVTAASGIQSGAVDFQFGTDEFSEFVGTFNDVFGGFINGGVATNFVRDSLGNLVTVNSAFFDIDNETTSPYNIEWDGMTSGLTATFPLVVGTNVLRFAVADAVDGFADTSVLLTDLRFSTADVGGGGVSRLPVAGDWSGILLDKLSNDRNVEAYVENEGTVSASDVNGTPGTAEGLGQLGKSDKESDDLLRLGFEVHGYLASASPGDVDVYSFKARPGTEIWLDIDRTKQSLDVVVEVLNLGGDVIARSNNSYDESRTPSLFGTYAVPGGNLGRILERTVFESNDNYTTNIRDAGMRIVLPGPANGSATDYYVRVRASHANVNSTDLAELTNGTTYGQYQLQIRLQQQDEVPGSIVSYAEVRYAANGIIIRGKPNLSPLAGEVAETELSLPPLGSTNGPDTNNVETNAQLIGNVTGTNRGTISIAGSMNDMNDVDWYQFTLEDVSGIGPNTFLPTIFDIDYAGEGRPDYRVSVFNAAGQLLYTGDNSNVADDIGPPLNEGSFNDLSRGSTQQTETFLGPVNLDLNNPLNPYYTVAISHSGDAPLELNVNTVRREPIRSLVRIAEDHIGFSGGQGAATLYELFDPFDLDAHAVDWHLGDVTLYVNTANDLFTVNPYTGYSLYDVTGANATIPTAPTRNYHDIAMRSDGRLYSLTVPGTGTVSNAIVGNYQEISTANGSIVSSVDDEIVVFTTDASNAPASRRDPATGALQLVPTQLGVRFEALAHATDGSQEAYAVGNIPLAPQELITRTQNLLYILGANGVAIDNPADPTPTGPSSPTDVQPRGQLFTGPTILPPRATDVATPFNIPGDILDGHIITITDTDGQVADFEFDLGIDLDVGPFGAQAIRDGNTFVLSDAGGPKTFEFNSGPVVSVGPAQPATHETITITDNLGVTESFEFLAPGDTLNDPLATAIPIGGTLAATLANAANVINADAFNAVAEFFVTPAGVGRLTFRNDNVVNGVLVSAGLTRTGDYAQGTGGSILINFEETDDFDGAGSTFPGFGPNIEAVVEAQFNNVIDVGFAERANALATDRHRLNFYNATAIDFTTSPVPTPGFQHRNDALGAPSASGKAATSELAIILSEVGFDALETAQAIAAAINLYTGTGGFDVSATASASQVELSNSTVLPTVSAPIQAAGNGLGGLITGLTWLNGNLYAVSDAGGFYIVNNPTSYQSFTLPDYIPVVGTGPTLQYVTTSAADLTGIQFSGLSAGPQNVEGGLYANLLFATDTAGNVYAFDEQGVLQPVFLNGESSIATGVAGARGLAFSTLDYNLFHATQRREAEVGHGLTYNLAIPTPDGSAAYYFGLEAGNYNLPGGAHGSLITNTFSLKNYSSNDQPFLYFNYFYDGEPTTALDQAKVYISADGANWTLLTNYDPLVNTGLTRGSGQWLQARRSLAGFAGQENLRLRFDFYTSGDTDTGIVLNTGELMHAVAGTEIADGDTFTLSDDPLFFFPSTDFEFDMGFSLRMPAGAGGLPLLDGEVFTVNGQDFEFDNNDSLTTLGATAVPFNASMSASDLAIAVRDVLNLEGIAAEAARSRVQVLGATTLTNAGFGALVGIEGDASGLLNNFFAIPVVVDITMTEAEIAQAVADAIDVRYAATDDLTYHQVAKVEEGLIRVIGHQILAGGPLPFSNSIPFEPFAQGQANVARAQNNGFEGFYFDDVTIGFAERGEAIFNAGANTAFPVVALPLPRTPNDRGPYDLEIRGGSTFDPARRGFDTNDRLTSGFYLYAPAGVEIQEGESFTINDGTRLVTFEFDSNNTLINPLAVRVPYTATSTDVQVATAIGAAINSVSFQVANNPLARLNTAARAIGAANWVLLTDVAALDLFAAQVTARTLSEVEGTNDTIATAVDSGLSSATPGTYIQNGRIGDNPTYSVTDAGLDVDLIRVHLDAGETMEVDTDYDPYTDNFDSHVRIFGELVPGSISPAGDVDIYSFPAVAGERFWALSDTGGTLNPGATSRDTVIELRDGNNAVILEDDDDDGTGNGGDGTIETGLSSVIAGYQFATTGTNYLRVRAFGGFSVIDPYALFATTTTAAQQSPEVEGNNTFGAANALVGPKSVRTAAIGVAGDTDFYSFTATAGDVMFIAADGDTDRDGLGTDIVVELRDTTGSTILLSANNSGSGSVANPAGEGFRFVIPASGTYFVVVRHFNAAGTGTYDLMVANTTTATPLALTPSAAELDFSNNGSAPGEIPPAFPTFPLPNIGSYLTFTAPATGYYYIGISGAVTTTVPGNANYDPVTGAGVDLGSIGSYTVRINVGVTSSLRYEEFEYQGDGNTNRDQGVTLVRGAKISNVEGYGILVDEAPRDATGSQTFPGAVRNLTQTNSARAVPGVTLVNNIISFVGEGGIRVSGDSNAVAGQPLAAAPYVRIMNNTIFGGLTRNGVGIQIDESATPSLLNNVLVNLVTGINQAPTAGPTIITGTAYSNNLNDVVGTGATGLGSNFLQIAVGQPLFVNAATGNFYPAVGSTIVDSAIGTLPERAELRNVKNDLGIAESPVKMPQIDALGQQRRDTSESNTGQGDTPFNDRGALERADTTKPTIRIINPADNDQGGLDTNPVVDTVRYTGPALTEFVLELVDGIVPFNAALGTGVDDATVFPGQFTITRDGVAVVATGNYLTTYNPITNQVRIEPLTGFWAAGTYVITVNNSSATGIKDLAGNSLQANQSNGVDLRLTIIIPAFRDYGDAPAGYQTLIANNGPSHAVGPIFLGAGVTAESDGQPSSTASGDGSDDGVIFNTGFFVGLPVNMTVIAAGLPSGVQGYLSAWIDWNNDGSFSAANERIAFNQVVTNGPNSVTVTAPTLAQGFAAGQSTFARFRFSTQQNLSFGTPAAPDGEVEDYAIQLGSTSPWQNPNPGLQFDVNGNGLVQTSDLTALKSELQNRRFSLGGSGPNAGIITAVPVPGVSPPPYIDVNGDNKVNTQDLAALALFIRNLLTPPPPGPEASGPTSLPSGGAGEASDENDTVFSAWGASLEQGTLTLVPMAPSSSAETGSRPSTTSTNDDALLGTTGGSSPTVFWEDVSDDGASPLDTLFADMAREQEDPLEDATGLTL